MTVGSVALRAEIFGRDCGNCGLCGEPVDAANYHLDHIVPETQGGPSAAENLQLAHPRCNRVAGAKRVRQPRTRFIVQLPDELANWVRTLAAEGRRPLNAQFQILIEEALAL